MAAGTYSVCCRAWNDGVAECRPAIEGTPGPPVYTCAGPNSCLTVTVSQPTYTIQGRKIIIPGDQEIDPAKSQIATLPGYGTANSSPYWFNGVSTGDHTVSVSVPAGYSVVSTLCYDRIGCHTDACASGLPLCPPGDPRGCDASCGGGAVSQSGSSRTVTVPACGSNGYADLWWHYTSLSTCAVTLPATGTVDIGDTTDLTATATVTGGVGSITNITFSSGTTGVATVSPSSFSSSPATTTVSGLSAGTSTVTATATMTGGIVCTPASTLVTVPACTVTLTPGAPPNPTSMTVGQTQPFSATLTNIIPTNVTFSSNTGHVTLGPPGDTLPPSPYFTTGTAASIGSSILTASAKFGGVSKCQGTATVNVGSNPAWLQVKDGDVTTNSDLDSPVSPVATIPYFEDIGPGGYPGVPAYGGSTTLTQDNVSVNGWLAKSGYNATKVYNSAYFINAIPSNLVPAQIPQNSEPGSYFTSGGTLDSYGYSWYEYDAATAGPLLTINSNASLLARKVVLIVKGADVSLKGNITLTDGTGFFLLVTSGNITVDPGVGGGGSANLKGIYVADGIFDTGTNSGGGDLQLWVRGSVAAYGGFNLQRDLGVNNPTTPAELFEFAPDQELLFPTVLGVHSMNWQEVAP